jgi:hypothetical protein
MDRAFGRARGVAVTVAAQLAVLQAAVAGARQAPPPGVHVDPASPTAKEYAVPFDAARAVGRGGGRRSGGTSVRGSSDDGSPLFGEGIRRRHRSHGTARSTVRRGASGSRPAGSRTSVAPAGTAGTPRSGLVPTLAVRPSGARVPPATARGDTGGTSPLLLVGAVLLAGALVGIPLRRLGRSGTEPAPTDPEKQG